MSASIGSGSLSTSSDEAVIDITPQTGLLHGRLASILTDEGRKSRARALSKKDNYVSGVDCCVRNMLPCVSFSDHRNCLNGYTISSSICSLVTGLTGFITSVVGAALEDPIVGGVGGGLLVMSAAPFVTPLVSWLYHKTVAVPNLLKEETELQKIKCKFNSQRDDAFNSEDLQFLLMHDTFPVRLLAPIVSALSLHQKLTALDEMQEKSARSILLSVMNEEDRELVLFIRNPIMQDSDEFLLVLRQLSSTFTEEPWALVYLLERIDPSILQADQVKRALRKFLPEKSFENLHFEPQEDKVTIFAGGRKTEVTIEKLQQYDFFKKYFREDQTYLAKPEREQGKLVLRLPKPSKEVGDSRILHAILRYIETRELPKEDLSDLMKAGDFYGVSDLGVYCAKKILAQVSDNRTQYKRSECRAIFQEVLFYCKDDGVKQVVEQLVARELENALAVGDKFLYWLCFARDQDFLNDLFHSFKNLPDSLSSDLIYFIWEQKPKALLAALKSRLKNEIGESENPVAILQTYDDSQIRKMLEDEVYGKIRSETFRPLWVWAEKRNKESLKEQCRCFLRENPSETRHWPIGKLPIELADALKFGSSESIDAA